MRISFRSVPRSRTAAVAVISIATFSAAGAATLHRYAVSSATGSGGATAFLQSSPSGSSLQGEVASSARTSITIPFGVLGEYDASGTTFGIGSLGISTTGYGVAGEALGTNASILGYSAGSNAAIEAASSAGTGDGLDAFAHTGQAVYADSTSADGLMALSGSSAGIYATSQSGDAIEAYSPSVEGINASSDTGDAIYANATSTGTAIYATSTGGDGVSTSAYGNGTAAVRAKGLGSGSFAVFAFGAANAQAFLARDSSATGTATAVNNSTQTSVAYGTYGNAGIVGESGHGPGVYGANGDGIGSPGAYADGGGVDAGVFGIGNDGAGLFGDSLSAIGAMIRNGSTLPTLYVNSDDSTDSSDYEIAASAGNLASDEINFHLDRSGNLYAEGSITSGSDTYQAISRNPNAPMATYSTQQTEATVEDVGSAKLINGFAAVPLAADFRQTIDTSAPYMVFITPYGENHGLYVASRAATGFVVRETGAHSTLAFDYRIIARPFGARHARLPQMSRTALGRKAFANRPASRTSSVSEPPQVGVTETDTANARARAAAARGRMIAARAQALAARARENAEARNAATAFHGGEMRR